MQDVADASTNENARGQTRALIRVRFPAPHEAKKARQSSHFPASRATLTRIRACRESIEAETGLPHMKRLFRALLTQLHPGRMWNPARGPEQGRAPEYPVDVSTGKGVVSRSEVS